MSYVGSSYGVFRSYPANTKLGDNGVCSYYDPRIRPWYKKAAAGNKNIVILIDLSVGNTKIAMAKNTAKAILNTASPFDFISVIFEPLNVSTLI